MTADTTTDTTTEGVASWPGGFHTGRVAEQGAVHHAVPDGADYVTPWHRARAVCGTSVERGEPASRSFHPLRVLPARACESCIERIDALATLAQVEERSVT